eukprot:Hpha_TRINITY_DN16801_c4_g5::TRINITY_DN16801_c4_g5_i2::g.149588::m.149588
MKSSELTSELTIHGDVHSFDLSVGLKAVLPKLSAVATLLETTEGGGHVEVVPAVHPNGPGTQLGGNLERSANVASADTGRQSVLVVVRTLDGIGHVLELEDAHHRPEDLLLRDGHAVGDVREHRRLHKETLRPVARPARDAPGALLLADLDVTEDLVELQLVHLGALHCGRLELPAHCPPLRLLGCGRDELVVNVLVDVETGRGAAALAVVQEETDVRRVDRLFNVGVLADDKRALATQFQRAPLKVRACGKLEDLVPDGGAPGEGDLVNVHVQRQRLTRGGTEAGDDVDNSVGVPHLLAKARHRQRGEGGLLACLHHNHVASGEGRPELPSEHEEGEVPRDDLPAHTHGLVESHAAHLPVHGDHPALGLLGPPRVVAEALNHKVQIHRRGVPRAVGGLAVVQRLQLLQVLLVVLDGLRELQHQVTPPTGVHLAPLAAVLESAAGGGNSAVDVLLVGVLAVCDDLLRRGVDRRKGLARRGLAKLPIDEVPRLERPLLAELTEKPARPRALGLRRPRHFCFACSLSSSTSKDIQKSTET